MPPPPPPGDVAPPPPPLLNDSDLILAAQSLLSVLALERKKPLLPCCCCCWPPPPPPPLPSLVAAAIAASEFNRLRQSIDGEARGMIKEYSTNILTKQAYLLSSSSAADRFEGEGDGQGALVPGAHSRLELCGW